MSANFDAILNASIDDISGAPPIPAGAYIATLGTYKLVERKKDNEAIDTIEWPLHIQSIYIDSEEASSVDEDALEEYGGITAVRKNKRLTYSIWMEDDDNGEKQFRNAKKALNEFLVGVCGVEGNSWKEYMSNSRGARVGIIIGHRIYNGNQQAVVKKVFKLD